MMPGAEHSTNTMSAQIKSRQDRSVYRFYWFPALVFAPVLWLVCRILEFNGLFGQESHEFLRYSQLVSNYLTGGAEPVTFLWPVVFPVAGAILQLILPDLLSLQTLSIIAAVFCFLFFCRTLSLMYPGGTQRQRYAIVFLLGAPFFVRSAVLGLPDMLCCAFLTAMYHYLVKYQRDGNIYQLVQAVMLGLLAVQTRYTSAFLLIILAPVVFNAIRKRPSTALLILGASVVAITPSVMLRSPVNFEFLDTTWLRLWSPANFFSDTFFTDDGAFMYTLPNIIATLAIFCHPAFCFIGPMLLFFYFRKKLSNNHQWWWISLIIYLLFIAGLPHQNLRLLFLPLPTLLLILYPGFEPMMAIFKKRNTRVFLITMIALFQVALITRTVLPAYRFQKEELEVVSMLKKYPQNQLYTFAIDRALYTYGVQHTVNNLWLPGSSSIPDGSLFLYNPDRFGYQLNTTPPGFLFRQLKREGRLSLLESTNAGWQLYSVQ
jgi:hypothetical protein